MSDVPVGVFLSGGIDSSTNAALFAEGERRPVQTFSIGYDSDYASYPSELPYAGAWPTEIGADHHERIISLDDLIAFLPEMVRLQDEPIADPVSVPAATTSPSSRGRTASWCARPARVRTSSSAAIPRGGRTSDSSGPTTCRYPGSRNAPDSPPSRRRAASGSRPYEFLRRGAANIPVFWGGAEAFTETQKQRLLGPELRATVGGLSSWDVLAPIGSGSTSPRGNGRISTG